MSIPTHHPLISAARAWFDAGFAVVPSHEDGGKRPWGRWKEFQSQRMGWDELETLLSTDRYTGIGVLTGSSSGNVEMIEIENSGGLAIDRLGKVFDAAATTFVACGVDEVLKEISRGCVEQSAGGGLHLFIRVSDGLALGNTQLATVGGKVVAETRGEGGFVVVAPTPGRNGHEEGASYIFINGGSPDKIFEVTTEERDMLHMLFSTALNEDVHVVEQVREQRAPLAVANAGTSAFDDYRERMSWKDILEPAGWTFSHSDAERDYWTRPGKTTHEGISASTITDGPLVNFSSSVNMPANVGLSKAMVYAHLHHNGDLSAAARGLSQDGFGSVGAHREIPAWEAILDPDATDEEREESQASWVRDRLPLLDWQALWADETKEEWIIQPLLAKRRLVALYSAPKVGKSLLMLELAASMACGRNVLGMDTRPIRTLYVDFENDPRGDIRERLQDMEFGPEDLENLCYLSFPTLSKLDTRAGSEELMAAVAEYKCEVVVIDTISRAIDGDENDNDTWLSFYRHTGLKMKQAGIAMIRLDHSGKDVSKGQRGGSAKSGDVDAVWQLSAIGDTGFRLTCEANRFPVGEMVVDLTRITGKKLWHKRDMKILRKATDEMIDKYSKAGISKETKVNPDGKTVNAITIKAAAEQLYQAGISFAKSDNNSYNLTQYCLRIHSFNQPEMSV
jgi:hypothetical protein